MTTAFVLTGGASLGAIQAGMLEALYEHDIRADLIVGTSAGALNGAFIADRPQTPQTARELADVWRGLSRDSVFPVNPLVGALGFLGVRSHLVPDSGLRRLMRKHVVAERLEDTVVPLHVIATDVLRGEEVRLSTGPLVDAVMASAAIPGVLPAVTWDGRELVDGGVCRASSTRPRVALSRCSSTRPGSSSAKAWSATSRPCRSRTASWCYRRPVRSRCSRATSPTPTG